jgi:hypothetical protein
MQAVSAGKLEDTWVSPVMERAESGLMTIVFIGSCNIMGNTDTLKITKGKDKIK